MLCTHAVIALKRVGQLVEVDCVQIGADAITAKDTMMRIHKADPLDAVAHFGDWLVRVFGARDSLPFLSGL